jgi:phosphopantothenoylcysteine synthetase/decarboxylase
VSTDLRGVHVLVTSGPTRADIDAVRYISNRSSGRLGCAVTQAALACGARVTLVAGPGSLAPPQHERLRTVPVVTVDDVLRAMEAELTSEDAPHAVVHAMAVLDYVPAEPDRRKTPSGREEWTLRLVRTPKVVRRIRQWRPDVLLVQFKLEVDVTDEQLSEAALASLARNRADLVVANDLARIHGDRHPALVLDAEGRLTARPDTKEEIAHALCRVIAERLGGERSGKGAPPA